MNINELVYNTFFIIIYIIILGVFITGVIAMIASWKRTQYEKTSKYNLIFFQIKLPQDNEIEIKAAEHMFSNLAGLQKGFWAGLFTGQYRISFEIVSKSNGIAFYVAAPDEIAHLVEKQINAAYPSAEIDIVNPEEIWDRGEMTQAVELKLSGAPYFPIKCYEDLKNDSLSSVTGAMSKMGDEDVIAVQYIIQPAGNTWRMAGRAFCGNVKMKAANPEKKVNIETSFLEAVEKKIAHQGFYTKVRIVSIAKDKFEAQSHIQNMMSAFEQFTDINYNKFVKRAFLPAGKIIDDFIFRRMHIRDISIPIIGTQIYSNTSVLNTIELATVFHFPNKNVETPNILWLGARRSAAPTMIPDAGLYLGKSIFRGVEKKIYMKDEDRTRHFYIIGQTGTGKSVFMQELALQDIRNGEGLAIIDPHGTDIDTLLTKIPEERIKDVVLFDASDTERPLGINMLEAHSEEEKHMIVNSFIGLLYKLYDPNHSGIMGPQLERAIRNVMLTAMTDPEATMVDVLRLLIDNKYAQKFIDKLDDPMVKRFWTDEMANTMAQHKSEKMGYFVSKFDRFVTDKTMRNILGQPKSAIDFNDIMQNKKILLVDLAKGKIGEENSNFIGLLLVPRILAAALGRHKLIGKESFPNFYLYVDEFQNFATPDFATILSEARKYRLNLIVAHQFVAQLTDDIKEAVFGNVGTMCSFRVGADDAEYLENHFSPSFTKRDLINLPVGNCYARLLVNGHPTPPFSMKVDWDEVNAVKKRPEIAAKIREYSRNKFGVAVEEVEAFVNKRMGFNVEQEQEDQPNTLSPFANLVKSKLPF